VLGFYFSTELGFYFFRGMEKPGKMVDFYPTPFNRTKKYTKSINSEKIDG